MPPTIEQVIAAIPDWAGRTRDRRADPGRADQHELPGRGGRHALLRADPRGRRRSCSPSIAATSSTTRSPRPRPASRRGSSTRCPNWDVFVLEWLDARTMSNETPAARRACRRGSPRSCGSSTPGPRFRDDFDMFRVAERYLALVDERDIAIPAGYREHLAAIPRIEAALGRPSAGVRPVPQRPAGRQLPRRRRAAVARRLGVQRQQRPDLRARQHGPGARLRRRPDRASCAPPTSARPPLPCSPGCASR